MVGLRLTLTSGLISGSGSTIAVASRAAIRARRSLSDCIQKGTAATSGVTSSDATTSETSMVDSGVISTDDSAAIGLSNSMVSGGVALISDSVAFDSNSLGSVSSGAISDSKISGSEVSVSLVFTSNSIISVFSCSETSDSGVLFSEISVCCCTLA